jgi:DNA mismatch endonuclease (patch repair protein)
MSQSRMTPKRMRDPAVTSRMMAAVKNRDSRAELSLRRALHARGLRYRLHARDIPGTPDIVIRSRKLAIFVDGDMWHGNPEVLRARHLERLEELFPTRTEWWVAKIQRNRQRDADVNALLSRQGWTVVRLWESEILKSVNEACNRLLAVMVSTDTTISSLQQSKAVTASKLGRQSLSR